MKPLTPRRKAFLREYVKDRKGADAARRSGIAISNASQYACRTLALPEAKAFLAAFDDWNDAELIISAQRVLEEFSRVAANDIGTYYKRNDRGIEKLKNLDELTDAQRACVKSIDVLEGKIEFWDKISALDRLGKHYKLFTEISEQRHTFTMMGDVKVGGVKLEFNIGTPAPKK